ncbi:MAG TPA: heavy metal-associated domain-containing protein [Ignavibacteria bacterium]|nr:heavy metal-associated domain-containing protein [Ignavibacteria bacterium]
MKLLILLALILSSSVASAQLSKAIVGVDGFTCSLCAKGVEGQLKNLDFVKTVKANLKATTFDLTFKTKSSIVVSEIASAISDGGFTLRDIKITASGILSGDQQKGFTLITGNSPDIKLSKIKGDFKEGDKISVSGILNIKNTSLNVSEIK